ncbi:hypothetical protein CEXT_513571 [Caerostris extrusa]|uniref:Uncharacterized protein n=1 Tax=Caerostris extrusa TaxID=172846 RepID=A0AAV4XH70_CAEEX|nr:hypothetical protein CEXT_513571 [Caerostris extrusa]
MGICRNQIVEDKSFPMKFLDGFGSLVGDAEELIVVTINEVVTAGAQDVLETTGGREVLQQDQEGSVYAWFRRGVPAVGIRGDKLKQYRYQSGFEFKSTYTMSNL